MNNQNPWKTLSSKVVYDNNWLSLIENDCLGPQDNPTKYTYLHCKKVAVGIIPIDQDGYTWLVGQYRYPLKSFEWEIPMGGSELGEELLTCAQRELAEETGLVAKHWEKLLDLAISDCLSDELACVYLAKDLTMGSASPEETEQLSLKKVLFSEAVSMVLEGQIRDSVSVAAILKLQTLNVR